MSFVGLNTAQNLSFYAIPAAWVLSIAPHFYAKSLFDAERGAGTPEWDIRDPKQQLARVKDAKLSPAAQAKFLRAEAAQDNGFTNIGLFAASILAGNFARLPNSTLNTAAAIYLASRIAYNFVYINNTTPLLGHLRSVTFLTGVITTFTLFIKAGNALY